MTNRAPENVTGAGLSQFRNAIRRRGDARNSTSLGGLTIVESRMKNPAMVIPDAMKALNELSSAVAKCGVPKSTFGLVDLRASQVNGCGVCVDMHARQMRQAGETDERLFGVAAWRDTPYFSDGERAALALTEAMTRLSDRADAVPDEVWNEASRYYDERALAGLLVAIATINVWNRLNVATRQIAGEWLKSAEARDWVEKNQAVAP
jgi:AhpD family alkylhydroperoxidase